MFRRQCFGVFRQSFGSIFIESGFGSWSGFMLFLYTFWKKHDFNFLRFSQQKKSIERLFNIFCLFLSLWIRIQKTPKFGSNPDPKHCIAGILHRLSGQNGNKESYVLGQEKSPTVGWGAGCQQWGKGGDWGEDPAHEQVALLFGVAPALEVRGPGADAGSG